MIVMRDSETQAQQEQREWSETHEVGTNRSLGESSTITDRRSCNQDYRSRTDQTLQISRL